MPDKNANIRGEGKKAHSPNICQPAKIIKIKEC